MEKGPKISVLMSVYNGEKYLCEAIESILNQTFKDFEFLIINDGSTDKTGKILESYEDSRIRIINNKENIGLTKSLNKGLKLAKGKYIARMDADDISLPKRFEKQVKFMDKNSEIAVCGTWLKLIGNNIGDIWKVPSDSETLRSLMLFYPALYHPTTFIRKALLEKYNLRYDESFICSQDYDLWARMAEKLKISNLKEVLLFHRAHPDKAGVIRGKIQVENANKVRLYLIHKLGIYPKRKDFEIHKAISYWRFGSDKEFVGVAESWLKKLIEYNEIKKVYQESTFSKVLAEKWFFVCDNSACLGLWIWRKFWASSLIIQANLTLKQKIVFALKCIKNILKLK